MYLNRLIEISDFMKKAFEKSSSFFFSKVNMKKLQEVKSASKVHADTNVAKLSSKSLKTGVVLDPTKPEPVKRKFTVRDVGISSASSKSVPEVKSARVKSASKVHAEKKPEPVKPKLTARDVGISSSSSKSVPEVKSARVKSASKVHADTNVAKLSSKSQKTSVVLDSATGKKPGPVKRKFTARGEGSSSSESVQEVKSARVKSVVPLAQSTLSELKEIPTSLPIGGSSILVLKGTKR